MEPPGQNPWMTVLETVLALVLPIAGLVIAIVLFATKRMREGTIVFIATIVGALFGILLYL
jgi:flagellar biosynthesis protein FliQ